MKIVCALGKFLAGIIATTSGVYTLICNDKTYEIFNKMPDTIKHIIIFAFWVLGIFLILTSVIDFINNLKSNSRKHRLNCNFREVGTIYSA